MGAAVDVLMSRPADGCVSVLAFARPYDHQSEMPDFTDSIPRVYVDVLKSPEVVSYSTVESSHFSKSTGRLKAESTRTRM